MPNRKGASSTVCLGILGAWEAFLVAVDDQMVTPEERAEVERHFEDTYRVAETRDAVDQTIVQLIHVPDVAPNRPLQEKIVDTLGLWQGQAETPPEVEVLAALVSDQRLAAKGLFTQKG